MKQKKTKHIHDDLRIDYPACVEWVKAPPIKTGTGAVAMIEAQYGKPTQDARDAVDRLLKKPDDLIGTLYEIPIKTGDWVGENDVVAVDPRDIPGSIELDVRGNVVKMSGRFYKRPR